MLGLGARVNFFGVEGAEQHAFPMYTLADAVKLRKHVLDRWEAADKDPVLVEDGALNVVVVGGGPTGVETAGALAELYRTNFAEDKGRGAWLAWGAVHLALLSTGEDRAKAVVDWAWAGFTHERAGRISVGTDPD